MPIVSVIIPVYNCEQTIAKSIKSARAQTLSDIEIIVVDDCSQDRSYDVIEAVAAQDSRIRCTRLPQNGGSSVARNTAIDQATGEWIAVLDADDWYEPKRLEILLNAALETGADFICDNLKIYDHVRNDIVDQTSHGKKHCIVPLTADMVIREDNPLRRHAIGYVKPMVKKAFLQAHNIRNDPVHRSGQDFIFLADIILSGARAFIIPDALYVYVHRISPTTRKISPHSRSDAGFPLIVRGCDELLQKYGASMDARTRRALRRRRWIFESRILCGDMIDAARQKNYGVAAKIFIRRPFVVVLIGATLTKWIVANFLLVKRKIDRSGLAASKT